MLDGGIPEQRAVLVVGGPGTGKTTLALQFLQAGLEQGENCLFISTEQTQEELVDAFSAFDLELEHDNLTVTTIHATTGYTLDDEEPRLTLQTLKGGDSVGDGYSAPFESKYIQKQLSKHTPVDRVVLDSVSGLSAIDSNYDRYRRAILDMIRLFSDDFEATSLFTAEESNATSSEDAETVSVADPIQYNTHGVIRLWRENVQGDYHRFMEIMKMRGVEHDTRVFQTEFNDEGVRLIPRLRTHPGEFMPDEFMPTDVEGLDELLGGGIVRGGTMLLEHDGQASPHSIITSLMRTAIEDDMALTIVPPVELPPRRFKHIIERDTGKQMREMLDGGQLYLIDYPNVWQNTRENVFKPRETDYGSPEEIFRQINESRDDRDMLSIVSIEAQLPVLDDDQMRRVRFWQEENLHRQHDTTLYFCNPHTMDDKLAEFYKNGAWQVIRTWINDKGLQYLKLKKSPSGFLGSTRLVEYTDSKPYMRIQQPPCAADQVTNQ
jgi:KaiC/GvpD/RAD55 family RecA-like ATPase